MLRVIETYDRAQTKRYKVYVDGQRGAAAHVRPRQRRDGDLRVRRPGGSAADDRVRMRFENQDDPAFYDPSIADVWTLPV